MADHGDRDHPGRRLRPHHRVVRLLDGAGADVAVHDLRARTSWRARSSAASPGLLIAMAILRRVSCTSRQYLHPMHFQNLGKLLLVMALLWGYFVFNERLVTYYGNEPSEMAVFWRTQRESFAPLYWTMVIVQLRAAARAHGHQAVPHDHRLRHRVARRRRRHVARALPDHRPVARAQVPAVQLRHLSPAAGGDHHRRRDVRGDDVALRAVREDRSDHFDLGAQGWRASAAGHDASALPEERRLREHALREGGLRALSGWPLGAAGA